MGKISAVLLTTYLCCCLFWVQFVDSRKFNSKRNDDDESCSEDAFYCNKTKQCVPRSWQCDGYPDCSLGEDEVGCPCEYKCEARYKCIKQTNVCDGYPDCADGQDEDGCHCPGFVCDNKQCVTKELSTTISSPSDIRCNGLASCHDGSDERNCDSCKEGTFLCASDAICVFGHWRCDGVKDCKSGEDEDGCPCEFKCEADDRCLKEKKVCDNYPDCSDGQDEDGCPCSGIVCNNKQCVPDISLDDTRCDGVAVCNDRTDEENCDSCKNGAFYCATDRRCIVSSWQCDGMHDCLSGDDESGCALRDNQPIVVNAHETED